MRPARAAGDAAPPFSYRSRTVLVPFSCRSRAVLVPPSGFEQEVGEGEFAHFGQAALRRAPALPPAEGRAEVRAATLRGAPRRRHRRSRQARRRQGDAAAARRLRRPAAQDAGFASPPFAERDLPQLRMPALCRPAPLRSVAAKAFPLAPVAPTPLVKKTHAPLRSEGDPGADPGPCIQAAKIVRKTRSRQYTKPLSGPALPYPRQAAGPLRKKRDAAPGRTPDAPERRRTTDSPRRLPAPARRHRHHRRRCQRRANARPADGFGKRTRRGKPSSIRIML